MAEAVIIGSDLARRVFRLQGAAADGSVVFRKKLARARLSVFLARPPACSVAMEACAASHGRGREITALEHAVRLIPPTYVKPFLRQALDQAAE